VRFRLYYEVPAKDWLHSKSRRTGAELLRENVRQWLLAEFIAEYHYPRDWLSDRLQLVDGASTVWGTPEGFFGFCVVTPKGDPFVWVSVEKKGMAAEAESRLRGALEHSPVARVGVCSDGTREGTKALRRKSDSPGCEYVLDIEPFSQPDIFRLTAHYLAPSESKEGAGRHLATISEAVEDVFFEAHSHIRDIDGMHADAALDELCKLLYAKLYDEEMTKPGKAYSLQRDLYATSEEFAAVTRRIYSEANEYDVRVFSLKIPGYERSRGVFNEPLRLSSPALAKVAETLQDYWLSASSIDVKGRAFQKVLVPGLRAGMGQYFTPFEVIQFMVDVASPTFRDLVLDPFAGSGHFLTQSLDYVRSKSRKSDEKRIDEFAYNKLHGIEKSDRMVRVAMTDMRLHGDGHSSIRCTDALLAFENYPDIRPESFDLILSNPPFGSLLGPEAIGQLGKFQLAQGRKNVPLEVLGLERCVQFLRPGGRLGIVLPDGILANRGTDFVRDWLAKNVAVRAIVSLPVETFAPFGASVKTSILFARKWRAGEKRTTDHSTHLTRIDNVGYEATGRQRTGGELATAAEELKAFLREEGW
jgi:type I restriction enzyme M protein